MERSRRAATAERNAGSVGAARRSSPGLRPRARLWRTRVLQSGLRIRVQPNISIVPLIAIRPVSTSSLGWRLPDLLAEFRERGAMRLGLAFLGRPLSSP